MRILKEKSWPVSIQSHPEHAGGDSGGENSQLTGTNPGRISCAEGGHLPRLVRVERIKRKEGILTNVKVKITI